MIKQTNAYTMIATWFGVGYSPFISGTMGSLATLPFAFVLHYFIGWQALLVAACILFIIGIIATEHYLKTTATNPDPKEVVIDEVAGQTLALALLAPTITGYVVGFLLFRLFDIIKPWPIGWIDRKMKSALGVMLDDMIAGLMAALLPCMIWFILSDDSSVRFIVNWMNDIVAPYVSNHTY